MKKLASFALITVLALGIFTACRKPEQADTATTTTSSAATTVTTTANTTTSTMTMPTLPDDTLDSTGPSESAKIFPMPRMPRR